jgi:hypothetical protein
MIDFVKTVKKLVNIKKYDGNSTGDPDYIIAYKVCTIAFIIGFLILAMKFIYPIVFVAAKIPTVLSLILIVLGYLGAVGAGQTLEEKSKKDDED